MKQHQKKYYGSLLFIVMLIVATAVVLQRSGSNDLVGMAADDGGYESRDSSSSSTGSQGGTSSTTSTTSTNYWYNSFNRIEVDDYGSNTYYVYMDKETALALSSGSVWYRAGTIVSVPADDANSVTVIKTEIKDATTFTSEVVKIATGTVTDDNIKFISSTQTVEAGEASYSSSEFMDPNDDPGAVAAAANKVFESTAATSDPKAPGTAESDTKGVKKQEDKEETVPESSAVSSSSTPATALPSNPVATFTSEDITVTIYDKVQTDVGSNQIDGQVFVQKGDTVTAYNIVDVGERTYFATVEDGKTLLVDITTGEKYEQRGDVIYKIAEQSEDFGDPHSGVLDKVYDAAYLSGNMKLKTILDSATQTDLMTEEQYKTQLYTKTAQQIARDLGISDAEAMTMLKGEETAIETYLKETLDYENVEYDPTTGQYSGKIGEYTVSYNDEGQMGVALGDIVVYKDTSTIPATYRTADGKKVDADQLSEAKKALREAEKEVEKIETKVQKELQDCGKKKPDDCDMVYTDADGNEITVSATARQEAYMNKIYEQQEAQVKGLLTGWLNNFIENGCCGWGGLGGWSRGVPAGICAHIFGLEYYKQDGWTRVPMNASADQLQSELIANSRTVIIEGEKEEITDSLFRYAYTIKLLANESVEWQTYMYNSCTAETSVDVFYDYGYLAPGAYFSFHYAGAGDVDMIFDCTQEDCLYDQACVAFTDGSAPTCVSLVHGAGFESPDAGSDYDCAITG